MGGGHIQLVAQGDQNMYINGNPQISFFKAIYRRHTNFSMECIEIQHAGTISSSENTLSYRVGRHGDLLYKCHLEMDLPAQNIGNTTIIVTAAGGAYYLDGVIRDSITLSVGRTYRFDLSDSSLETHPLRFSTTSDGTHSGGSTYTTGVTVSGTQGQAGAYIEIELTSSTPTTLYYYCTAHSGMGSSITVFSPSFCNYSNNTAHSYVKTIDLEIGNKLIDRHYGRWYDIRNTMWDKNKIENILINKHDNKSAYLTNKTLPLDNKIFCPLHFWFCEEIGLALPLIALQYHDVDFKITYRGIKDIINSSVNIENLSENLPTLRLWANYIYLDNEERKKFAQSSHEYLFEQIQETSNHFSSNVPITLNHSVKEIFWVIQNNTAVQTSSSNNNSTLNVQTSNNWNQSNDYLNYLRENDTSDSTTFNKFNVHEDIVYDHFDSCKMVINGLDRFPFQKAPYFRTIEPYNTGHAIPFDSDKLIYMYSFALKPTEYQPSGVLNFSKLDSVSLNFKGNLLTNYTITIYAVNYNVLRIMSGMGGLLYSN